MLSEKDSTVKFILGSMIDQYKFVWIERHQNCKLVPASVLGQKRIQAARLRCIQAEEMLSNLAAGCFAGSDN